MKDLGRPWEDRKEKGGLGDTWGDFDSLGDNLGELLETFWEALGNLRRLWLPLENLRNLETLGGTKGDFGTFWETSRAFGEFGDSERL